MIKRTIATLISASMLFGTALCANAAEANSDEAAAHTTIKLGDADGDGAINAVDASIILSNYARYSTSSDKPSEYELITQDVNDDGLVNAVDASIVLSYYAYRSIGGFFNLSEYIKNPDEAPTESVTATTTAAATTTTATTTTQTTTEPATYDYTLENITQSAEVFNYFAEQMNNDLFEGASVVTKRFYENEESYDGKMQAKVALLILNENANFKDSVLKTVFAGYDDALIREGVEYFFFAPMVEKVCGSEIDYSIYSIDKNIGNYINQLKEARKNGDTTGDYTNMDKILEDILYNGKYDYVSSNIAATYYSIGIGAFCTNSKYHGDCLSFSDDESFCGIQGETEDRVKALIK